MVERYLGCYSMVQPSEQLDPVELFGHNVVDSWGFTPCLSAVGNFQIANNAEFFDFMRQQ